MQVLFGLVRQEVARIVTRRRFWLTLGVFALLSLAWMYSNQTTVFALAGGMTKPTGPMLALGALDTLSAWVILAPLVMGGTLAEDRRSGLDVLILTRANSRFLWVTSKAAAAGLVAFTSYVTLAAFVSGVAQALAGWDERLLADAVGLHAGALSGRPLPLLVFTCLLFTFATTATVTLSAVVGTLTRAPIVAQLTPALVVLGCALAVPGRFNPYTRASFLTVFDPWNTLFATGLYWLIAVVLTWVAAVALAQWREG